MPIHRSVERNAFALAAFSLHADRPQKLRLQRLLATLQRLVLGEVRGWYTHNSFPRWQSLRHSRAGDLSVIPAQAIRMSFPRRRESVFGPTGFSPA